MAFTENWVDFQKSEVRNGTGCPSETYRRVRFDEATVRVPTEAKPVRPSTQDIHSQPSIMSTTKSRNKQVINKVTKISKNMLTFFKKQRHKQSVVSQSARKP